jgi:hypothetical protein
VGKFTAGSRNVTWRCVLKRTLTTAIVLALCVVVAFALIGCSGGAKSASSPGEQLVLDNCGSCHPADRALSATKDAAGWGSTVDRMKTHGLQISDADKAAIVEYLSTK